MNSEGFLADILEEPEALERVIAPMATGTVERCSTGRACC